MRKLIFFASFLFCFVSAHAQFTYHVYVPQWYDKVRVDSLFWLNSRDTLKYPAATYPGSLVFRQQTADTAFYFSNGRLFQKIPAISQVIQNSQFKASGFPVFNVDKGAINQVDSGTSATQFAISMTQPFKVQGGKGLSTTYNAGTSAQAGSAGTIQIYGGAGGDQFGTAITSGGGGVGGNLDFTAGAGGLSMGNGTYAGTGGNVTLQGGNAGATTTSSNPGTPGYVKVAGGSQPAGSKGDGGDIFIIPGAKGTGRDGDVMLGTSPSGPLVRGRTLVSYPQGTVISRTQRFQVNGSSYFADSVITSTSLVGATLTVTTGGASGKVLTSDGVGNASWQSPSSTPGALKDFYTTIGNTSATANTFSALYQYTIPANTLVTDGDKIRATYGGIYASNANNKTLEIVVNGNAAVVGSTPANGGAWDGQVLFIRTSSTTGRLIFTVNGYSSTGSQLDITGLNYTTTITFDLWGAGGGATNDVVAKLGTITKISAAP
ncbi:hypothetical protein DCC81_24820 [Chitinophaga parva]|uniref:Uncharacterized protein n=1 Tax=Chitinophaga parva TaxID=2169414 RepID=A0A2T7BBP0_9BACT|nr:hypothetical protein [Chitinophaga parva]PUZ21814.1 hypothetical protein DCC81_24820 [Chitinophaga parva]